MFIFRYEDIFSTQIHPLRLVWRHL